MYPFYSREAYLKAYEPAISPTSGPNGWKRLKKNPIHAPKKMKLLGRPKKSRRREPDKPRVDAKGYTCLSRKGIRMACSKCKQKGHTRRRCPLDREGENMAPKASGRHPPLNTNKCRKCNGLAHNARTCQTVVGPTTNAENVQQNVNSQTYIWKEDNQVKTLDVGSSRQSVKRRKQKAYRVLDELDDTPQV